MQFEQSKSWWGEWRLFVSKQSVAMFFLGFSAGLPFLLVSATLSAWLRDAGLEYRTIGYFAWVGLAFSLKFFWAPVVDRIRLPVLSRLLGQRRGWLLLAQLGVAVGLLLIAQTDPGTQPIFVAQVAVLIALCAATQDVCVDAYRIQAYELKIQGVVTSSYIAGYRVALLVAGAGALLFADIFSWNISYTIMAACMAVGLCTTLLVSEPASCHQDEADERIRTQSTQWLQQRFPQMNPQSRALKTLVWLRVNVVEPFAEMTQRFGKFIVPLLILVLVYRISDIAMGNMANPFYLALGYTKSEIAWITKVFGLGMTLLGAALGGILIARKGLYLSLVVCAVAVILTNLLFAMLALFGVDCLALDMESINQGLCEAPAQTWLGLVISMDNLAAGASNVAFIAFLSNQVSLQYSATQYALLSSIMTLLGKFISGFSGLIVEGAGFAIFFSYVAVLGLPALVLLVLVRRMLPRSFEQ